MKIICYIGPSLPLSRATELCPEAIFRPPAAQCDILSDAVEIQPDAILLVDGQFLANLSVWHRELTFCLTRGIKVCGAASMGALRAADLWRQGMIGYGKIFELYRHGITEDDAEVALLYSQGPNGLYYQHSVPQINLRVTLGYYQDILQLAPEHVDQLLQASNALGFRQRTREAITKTWEEIVGKNVAEFIVNNIVDQKALDAFGLLRDFRELAPASGAKIPPDAALSKFFWTAYDRDRRITVRMPDSADSVRIAQQHIDGYIALHAIDYPQINWDARNFYLTHILAEKLGVQVNPTDIEREWARFQMRHSITNNEQAIAWMSANALTTGEVGMLMVRMAMVRKLHQWLTSTLVPLGSTKITLDYLKMHDSYQYWAQECAGLEKEIALQHIEEQFSVSSTEPVEKRLSEHAQKAGITIDGNLDEFIEETGFGSRNELGVALDRLNAVKKED
jgi:hypothetical protein